MAVVKTKYEQTKICDIPLYKEASSVQEILSVKSIDESGVFELNEKKFSKMYILSDVNFAGVTDEEQKGIIISFSKVLKTIPCRFSYSVANEYVDDKVFHEKLLYQMREDSFDELRKKYNHVMEQKVSDAKQGLYQTIYITLTIQADHMTDARQTFLSIESAVRSAFIGMGIGGMQGSVMKAVSINQRMQLLFQLFHMGITHDYHFDFYREYKAKKDWMNIISPVYMNFENERFQMNGYFGKVMYIDEYPKSLESDILTSLSKINCTSYVTVNNELLDKASFKQEISRKYMAVGMKIENEKTRNRNNNDFLADASQKLLNEKEKLDVFSKELDSRDDHYFNSTILILFFGRNEEELIRIGAKLKNIASLKSLRLKSCFGKQKEALNSVLPLGIQEFKRVVNLSSPCLAMFMPFKTQELNHENGNYYGINQLSQNAILADKKQLKNHNGLIFGQSGSGKSVFAKSEMISTRINHTEDKVIAIDIQHEYSRICDLLQGEQISFNSTNKYYLNPMDVDFEGVDYSKLREVISEKADFLLTLLSCCMKRELSPEEQGILDGVIDKVYSENFAMRKRLNGEGTAAYAYEIPDYMKTEQTQMQMKSKIPPKDQVKAYSPTLQDVYQGLLDEGSKAAIQLAAAMEIFVNGSLNLFNHKTNVDLGNHFIVFDLSGLKENLRVTAMLSMLETIRTIIKDNSTQGIWTHIYIDEFHELLSVPQVADFILKLWKEIRKMSGILNGITQNMSDLLNEENGTRLSAILSNTECFALLSQSTLDKEKLMHFLPQISPAMFNYVDNADPGTGLLKMGNVTVPFDMRMSRDSEIYHIIQTDGGGFSV